MKDSITECYELGRNAGLFGDDKECCTFRLPEKRNAWLRGWHDGDRLLNQPRLSEQQKIRNRAKARELRAWLDHRRQGQRQ